MQQFTRREVEVKAGEAREPAEPRAGQMLCENPEGEQNPDGEGKGGEVPGGALRRAVGLGCGTEEFSQSSRFHTLRCQRQKGTESTEF